MLMIVKGCEKKSFGVISITRVTVGCMDHTLRFHREGSPPGPADPGHPRVPTCASRCHDDAGGAAPGTGTAGSARGRRRFSSRGGGGSARGGGRAMRGVVAAPAAGEGRDVSPYLGRAPVGAETPGPVGARVDEHALTLRVRAGAESFRAHLGDDPGQPDNGPRRVLVRRGTALGGVQGRGLAIVLRDFGMEWVPGEERVKALDNLLALPGRG